jgi:hypothetical protein
MIRKWHPFWNWEDVGMWRSVGHAERKPFLDKAIIFTGDAEKYGASMLEVIDHFPVACEHNLTDVHQNRLAWIGHAACYLAFECPEDIVRQAWGMLSEEQRSRANAKAQFAVNKWEAEHHEKQNSQLCLDLAQAGL